MNKYREAEKNVRFLSQMLKGLAALDEPLEKLGSIDKMIEDAEGRLAAVNAEVADADAKIKSVDDELALRLSRSEEDARQARNAAAHLRVEAGKVLDNAQKQYEHAVKQGQIVLAKADDDAKAIVAAARAEADRIAGLAEAAQAELNSIKSEIAVAEDRRSKLDDELARVRKFLG
jgi:chromosome segregation ATPase